MKTKEKKQLGEKAIAELSVELRKVQEEIAIAMLDKTSGKLKNTSSLTNKKKVIAIIKTKIREKELLGGANL
jgi:ribosomal protein L29